MGKYDLEKEYDENQNYSLSDLAKVIIKENENKYKAIKNHGDNEKYTNIINKLKRKRDISKCADCTKWDECEKWNKCDFRDKCKETYGCKKWYRCKERIPDKFDEEKCSRCVESKCRKHDEGIITKLDLFFNFKVQDIASKSKKDTFEMLKLLKYLFDLEKAKRMGKADDEEKSSEYQENTDVNLFNMLNKPHIENIDTNLSENGYNAKLFVGVFDKIKSVTPNYMEIIYQMHQIVYCWNNYLVRLLEYVKDDPFFDDDEITFEELNRIKHLIKANILYKIKKVPSSRISDKKIFETFFCIINSYKIECIQNADIVINPDLFTNEDLSYQTLIRLSGLNGNLITWDAVELYEKKSNNFREELYEKFLEKFSDDPYLKKILKASFYYNDKVINLSDFNYALKHAKTVAAWYGEYVGQDFQSHIDILDFVSIIQEIIYVKKNKIKVCNKFIGHNNSYRTLTSAFSRPDNRCPIVIYAWQKRIQNRILANTGRQELMYNYHKLEQCIYDIEKFIFSFRNVDDMKLVSDFLYTKAIDCIPKTNYLMGFADCILKSIEMELLQKNFKVEFSHAFLSDLSFFKMVILDSKNNDKIKTFLNDVNSKIIILNLKNSQCGVDEDTLLEFEHSFQSYTQGETEDAVILNHEIKRSFKISYNINLAKKTVTFLKVYEIKDGKDAARLLELGFDSF